MKYVHLGVVRLCHSVLGKLSGRALAMFLALSFLSLLFTLSHCFGNREQFITDILNWWDVDHCDIGLVSDGEGTTISNEITATLSER